MEYEVFTLQDEEIKYQTVINGLVITPYNDGICVNFTDKIALSCRLVNGMVIKIDKYIIYVVDKVFYIGVSNG